MVDEALAVYGNRFRIITTADEWYKTAETAFRGSEEGWMSGSEMQSDANGNIVYSNMAEGVYLIVQSKPDDPNVSVLPMVISFLLRKRSRAGRMMCRLIRRLQPVTAIRNKDPGYKTNVYINQDTFDVIEMEADDATYKVGLFLDDKGTIPFGEVTT